MMRTPGLILIAAVIGLFGCAGKNSVTFVTKTSLGLEFDTKPATANIAYDRVEGYLGPRYANGAVPPVIASIQSDLKIWNPKVRQVYATGRAAYALVGGDLDTDAYPDLSGEKELMFFGTSTTTGFKIGFTAQKPDSMIFGFKRKEFSFIPLGTKVVAKQGGEQVSADVYPSVLASIDTTGSASAPENSGLRVGQFFATGAVADKLAQDPEMRGLIKSRAQESFAAYYSAVSAQEAEALGVLRCFSGLPEDDLVSIYENAGELGLFYEEDTLTDLKAAFDAGDDADESPGRDQRIRESRQTYADDIGIVDGATATRTGLLLQHKEFVCKKLSEVNS